MPDTNNTLSTSNTGGITLNNTAPNNVSESKNDAQYPYSNQDGQTSETGVAAQTPYVPYAGTPAIPLPIATEIGAVYVDEANRTLEAATGTASVQMVGEKHNIQSNKTRLEAQNKKAELDIQKRESDFRRAVRNAKASAGLDLFIKIAIPVAALLVTVATLGTGSLFAAGLIAYSAAAMVVQSTQGSNIGMAALAEKGMYEGLRAAGMSEEDAHQGALIGVGIVAAVAARYSPELLLADPEFAGKGAEGVAQSFTSDQNAALTGAAVGAAAGLAAGGRVMSKVADKAAARSAALAADGGEAAAAGAKAADGAGKAAQAAKEVARAKKIAMLVNYANFGAGGMSIANAGAGGALSGLEFQTSQARLDMQLNQNAAKRNEIARDATQDNLGRAGGEFAAILKRFQEMLDIAMEIQAKKHKGSMQIFDGQVGAHAS